MKKTTCLRILVLTALAAGVSLAEETPAVRISEEDAKKLIVTRVSPDYPTMAKNMHLAGRVVVDVFIDEDGKVAKAQPVNGNPLLSGAAVTAVKKWQFKPFNANGQNRKAVTALAFDFKL